MVTAFSTITGGMVRDLPGLAGAAVRTADRGGDLRLEEQAALAVVRRPIHRASCVADALCRRVGRPAQSLLRVAAPSAPVGVAPVCEGVQEIGSQGSLWLKTPNTSKGFVPGP
jgi:hypothetical protein